MNWTPETIAAELAICEAATAGPWESFDKNQGHSFEGEKLWRFGVSHESGHPIICMTPLVSGVANAVQLEDMEFVAHARTGYPEALKEIARLQAELARLSGR